MNGLSRFWGRIGTKMYLALLFAVALTLLSSGVGFWNFHNTGRHTHQVRDESVPTLEAAWQVRNDARSLHGMGSARLGAFDGADVREAEARVVEGLTQASADPSLRALTEQVELHTRDVARHIEELIMARGRQADWAVEVQDVGRQVDLAASGNPELLSAMVLVRAALRADDEVRLSKLRAELADLTSRPPEVPAGYSALFENVFETQGEYLRLVSDVAEIESLLAEDALAMDAALDELLLSARQESNGVLTASVESFDRGRLILMVISGASVLVALGVGWLWVGRGFVRRLSRLSERMHGMAGGDFETPVPEVGQDEVGELAHALELFREYALEVQRLNLVEQLADELQEKNLELEGVLAELRTAQEQVVLQEKLAALGELTAGVAHEIKNPLNLIINFAGSSYELMDELNEVLDNNRESFSEEDRVFVQELSGDLVGNLDRIKSNGDRADGIVQDMLMMSRGSSERRPVDLNRLVDEHVRLAYHSARATDPDFALHIEQELGADVGEVVVSPQDIGRVFINIASNACYATNEKRLALWESGGQSYVPTLWVNTSCGKESIQVSFRDNGPGIPSDVAEKIFNPFFTTKPTGHGTGLGLSICNDLIRQHGGSIDVESGPGEYTEMTITLPLVHDEDDG